MQCVQVSCPGKMKLWLLTAILRMHQILYSEKKTKGFLRQLRCFEGSCVSFTVISRLYMMRHRKYYFFKYMREEVIKSEIRSTTLTCCNYHIACVMSTCAIYDFNLAVLLAIYCKDNMYILQWWQKGKGNHRFFGQAMSAAYSLKFIQRENLMTLENIFLDFFAEPAKNTDN